ncbi:hypothetical protein NC652_000153 [Populus alba x Populus x berolinensis]|uniref:Uncharacterized protein n=2 Tax=Populus TaxID=3689 RepID=A0A3N7F9B0_POPTR|nr:hypothetical protein NC651_000117 [Populus alba x Populus x berolinensis]KAJ6961170.1 hypothetical protein NC652_000153 [Populus alba x Populus x berolinensis]KAJ7009408.1 hypothetical protein NC653_000171 [Populus alba x Populus x berolinensis]
MCLCICNTIEGYVHFELGSSRTPLVGDDCFLSYTCLL